MCRGAIECVGCDFKNGDGCKIGCWRFSKLLNIFKSKIIFIMTYQLSNSVVSKKFSKKISTFFRTDVLIKNKFKKLKNIQKGIDKLNKSVYNIINNNKKQDKYGLKFMDIRELQLLIFKLGVHYNRGNIIVSGCEIKVRGIVPMVI